MALDLPKRFFRENEEPEVVKINNSCKTSLMKKLKDRLPNEYEEVKQDPVFAHILAIHEQSCGYSGKLIHSFMCKQLDTMKLHELWFVFARRPLRFSLQEFYAVTGLNYVKPDNLNIEEWIDDDGFWSRLLKSRRAICLVLIKKKYLLECHNWTRVDRVRLVYLCVIASLLVVNDEKVAIAHSYIKLVMDIRKLRDMIMDGSKEEKLEPELEAELVAEETLRGPMTRSKTKALKHVIGMLLKHIQHHSDEAKANQTILVVIQAQD